MDQDVLTFRGRFGFLSNFSSSVVYLDGRPYSTVEHAYQAAKTLDLEQRVVIQQAARTPIEAKSWGKTVPLREDWEGIKLEVMEMLLRQKFSDPQLFTKLLDTGNGMLVEGNSWHDNFWGACSCSRCGGAGRNHLGRLLMNIRTEWSGASESYL